MYCKGVIAVLLCVVVGTHTQGEGPVRETVYGNVGGSVQQDSQGRTYEEYLGIPFGAPPVDDLRWEKAGPPDSWEGVRNATQFAPHCTQFISIGYPAIGLSMETSEDCLYLNVYVPGENRVGDDLTVMYYIYGGAYFLGTAAMYPGYDLALTGNVIVVVVNYRVGSIGGLSTEDEVAPGNYGLWDTQLGLEWVRDNIAAFGGDPDSVTVFGQSAGGAMTSHVMISPATQGLFNRGIAISGTSSGYFGVSQPGNLAESTQMLARVLDCRRLNGSEELIGCLREKNATAVDFWGFAGVIAFQQQLPNWIPRIDGDFIPIHPAESWENGAASGIDYMTGHTQDDAAPFVFLNFLGWRPNSTFNFASTPEFLNTTLAFITNQYPGDTDAMLEAIYTEYPLMLSDDLDTRTQATTKAATDLMFKTHAAYEMLHHSSNSNKNTYLYNFFYDPSFLDHPYEWIEGAHLDDLYSILGEPFMEVFRDRFLDSDFNDDDKLLKDYVSSYYTNFAKTGNPNEGLPVPLEWPTFNMDDREYLEFKVSPEVLPITDDMIQTYDFWSTEFAEIAIPPPDYEVGNDRKPYSINDMSDEEFERVLSDTVELIKMWFIETLGEDSDELQDMLHFIDTVVEERQQDKLL